MLAMVLDRVGCALRAVEIDTPRPGPHEVLLRVLACGVCRTDLHVVDGDLHDSQLPLVLGHEIVGVVSAAGESVKRFRPGDTVGVPWLASTCRDCEYCRSGRENLCGSARFTGYHVAGGYAEYTVADADYCFPIPPQLDPVHVAPLLCAGLIGLRCLRAAGDAAKLGLYGFGAAAHIVAQVARFEGRRVFAFTRKGDAAGQSFARRRGAEWAGGSEESPPELLDAAIIFAPVGELVPRALRAVKRGGVVICGGIHMTQIPSFPYELLWGERVVRSVANLTRSDADELFAIAPRVPVVTDVRPYRLLEAQRALEDLRTGRIEGAAVLVPDTRSDRLG